MIFHQYFLQCLSQLSYLIGDETTGRAVCDVGRPDTFRPMRGPAHGQREGSNHE
jgi:hypothetical protein